MPHVFIPSKARVRSRAALQRLAAHRAADKPRPAAGGHAAFVPKVCVEQRI